MPRLEIELRPVTHILTDAIGPPGKRIFYIQAWQGEKTITVITEKFQIQSLAVGAEQFILEINAKYPDLPEASRDYDESKMHIHPPIDPIFRSGEIGLGYDADNDLIVLIVREAIAEGENQEDAGVVRFWCTRSQLLAMSHWGIEVASRGRQTCPQCGEPMDPAGHFCPKKNGHLH